MSQDQGVLMMFVGMLGIFMTVLITIASMVISFICWGKIGKKCGFSFWWTAILMSLPLVNFIMFLVLAFSKRKSAA